MQAKIIRVGNSKGLRLSKTILEKYEITDKVELILQEDGILLRPLSNPRSNWDEKFRTMREANDDKQLIADVFVDEEIEEWN